MYQLERLGPVKFLRSRIAWCQRHRKPFVETPGVVKALEMVREDLELRARKSLSSTEKLRKPDAV